jgi:hypothetical protein
VKGRQHDDQSNETLRLHDSTSSVTNTGDRGEDGDEDPRTIFVDSDVRYTPSEEDDS